MAKKFNGVKLSPCDFKPFVKNYCRDHKLFLITFYFLYLSIFAVSLFIVLNYESTLSHDNYYQMLMSGEYSFVKVSLKFLLINLGLSVCAMFTYRKKYAFAVMYFFVTFIAYRLAVNIVGSWCSNNIVNTLNATLFYFPIFTIFVISIVTILCHINKYYLYCNDRCPVTLKKMCIFTGCIVIATSICILVFTLVLPLIIRHILF